MQAISLILVILWAGTAPVPRHLRVYFDTQFVATLLTFMALHVAGFDSGTYTIFYALTTLAILVASYHIVWTELQRARWATLLWSSFSAVWLSWVIASGLPPIATLDRWVVLVEANALISAGIALVCTVPFSAHRQLTGALAILWLVLAWFDYGFLVESPRWSQLNEWLPAWLCVAAFGWIGFRSRQSAGVPARPLRLRPH